MAVYKETACTHTAYMRHFYSFLLTISILFIAGAAKATHIYGADFFYEYLPLSGSYRISLVVYGDCSGQNFPLLQGATPQVFIRESGVLKQTLTLTQAGAAVEVTPVCPSEVNNTACKNAANPLPGVTRYIYTGIYAVPYASANWVFRFDGDLPSPASNMGKAGRSLTITNIGNGGGAGTVMALEAKLNNLSRANSSPQFTTIPTPFYCVNVAQQYNPGAVDVNNDSLVYALTPGIISSQQGGGYVTYISPYLATAPLATVAGSFSFSASSGQLNFTPSSVQRALVVQEVSEYRGGVLVGTASREMTFVVLANCNNTPASNSIDTVAANTSGGVPASHSTNTFNVCEGTDSMHFNIIPHNLANDTIFASVNGLPAGATATITQNNTTNPVISFAWKPTMLVPGNYNFFVTYKDNGCPLSSQQTQAYTIQVFRPNAMTTSIVAPTQCVHKALVQYNFAFGLLPRHIVITQSGNPVTSFTDASGMVRDSLGVGTYTVTITSPDLPCATVYTLQIVDSGVYPFPPRVTSPVFYCLNDLSVQLVAKPDSGAFIKWYAPGGILLPGTPTPPTDVTGIFTWYLNQRFKVCESPKDSIKVYVTKRPIASIAGPETICLSDTASISFNGTIGEGPILDYIWDWGDAGYTTGKDAGPWQVHWFSAGVKIIKLHVEENKCPSAEVQDSIIVKPVPYAGFSADNEVCQYDTLRVMLYNTKHFAEEQYTWNFDGATLPSAHTAGPYTLSWHTPGTKHLTLSIDLDGCIDTRSADIVIRPVPDIRITNLPGPVCIGDKIFLAATGAARYVWSPQDSMLFAPDGRMYAQILKPSVYKVVATSEYGCIDSTSINYSDVEPCCNFSYPNAFSPNADGHNDRFRVVTYGNQQEYELSIYNKWGQRVYYGLDAKEGWDGTFAGKPCEGGTYFYYLNARCFTGHQESHKGDLILLR